MLNTEFSPWPSFSVDEIDAVRKVLLSNKVNYWTGNECREFEKEFAKYIGVKNAVLVSSGGMAIQMTLRGLGFKPGDEVYWEHPGLCWFKVTVRGTMGYAGLPRGIPGFRSSIVPAADVIKELESWLTTYPDNHLSSQIRPEGWLAAIRSGWPEKPAFPSAATEIYLDIRTNPNQSNASLKQEFDEVMQNIVDKYEDVEADWDMYASCQAAATDPGNWIVQSALRGWEERHGKPYPGAPLTSGQTDAATINQLGIPIVRIGYPFAVDMPEEYNEGLGGMGVARISDLIGPCESVIYSAIDTCTRDRSEINAVSS